MTAHITWKQPITSQCIICGRDYYGKTVKVCPRCGGLCSQYTQHDMQFLERRQTRGEIVVPGDD